MPTAERGLAGVRVLVTRPPNQAAGLAALVRRAGGEPVSFPTLEVESLEPATAAVEALARSDTVIFISANAVTYGYRYLPGSAGHDEKSVIAIGRATRRALAERGCYDVHTPAGPSTSEDLLAEPFLRDVRGRRICIVRGEGGRDLLMDTLSSRGGRVCYLECYRRRLPARWEPDVLTQALDDEGTSLVVSATSVGGLSNLLRMTPIDYKQRLLSRPLVVIGARQKAAALDNGWVGPVLESEAGDEQLVDTIIDWRGRS